MVLPAKTVFESTLLALPKIFVADYTNFTRWIADNVDGKLNLNTVLPVGANQFVFNQSVMISAMASLVTTGDQSIGTAAFLAALDQAVTASVFTIASGAFIGTPTPPNTFSAPPAVTLDPASVVAANAIATSDLTNTPVSATEPVMANALRNYFLALTYSVSGLNSLTPPTPLVATALTTF